MLREFGSTFVERLRPLYGLIFALTCALGSEVLLRGFTGSVDRLASLGRITVVFLALYVVHRFASSGFRTYRLNFKNLACLIIIMLGQILCIWLGKFLAAGITYSPSAINYFKGISVDSWYFAFPYAAGCLIIQSIMGLQFSLLAGLSLALIVGVYSPGQPILIPYVIATSLVASLSLQRFRSRADYVKAGVNVSLFALPFSLASVIIDPHLVTSDIIIRMIGALASGVLCTFIVAGVTPIFEHLGGYVTDMRLIEMATLDHPILKELSVQAPGTWNHSMVMGMMVESASDAVGANAVVARVGAYFHDIGKIRKPLYFVENQGGGDNRHDRLSTSMSALIIRSHVKDGIELARKHSIPQVIEDMIPQHHGTSLIEYFYDKANREALEADPNAVPVDRGLYSYPGPKPQTREAGILMLADGIEAAARTLSDPTHDRIQGLVQKMMNKVFASGELDECELTLKDLHQIAKAFTRVLTGIYHQRIAYEEPEEKNPDDNKEFNASDEKPVEKDEKIEKTENLKRLGI